MKLVLDLSLSVCVFSCVQKNIYYWKTTDCKHCKLTQALFFSSYTFFKSNHLKYAQLVPNGGRFNFTIRNIESNALLKFVYEWFNFEYFSVCLSSISKGDSLVTHPRLLVDSTLYKERTVEALINWFSWVHALVTVN